MIFLDTSFLVAYYNTDDVHHKKAIPIMQEIKDGKYGETCINDCIVNECGTVNLLIMKNISKTKEILASIIQSSSLVHIDEQAFQETYELFTSQDTTQLSFTDCSIIATMREKRIIHLVTFDQEFKKVKGIVVID